MKYLFGLSIPLLALDQLTKGLIMHFIPFGDQIPMVPGLFNLVYVANTGAAFSMFQNNNLAFIALAAIALIVVITLLIRAGNPQKKSLTLSVKVSMSLLAAGIAGNLIDRIVHGQVTDFLDFYIGQHHWPSFNVADSCICVAAALLVIGQRPVAGPKARGSRGK
jgi:signal peptidase II